jgi:hypothetical protein
MPRFAMAGAILALLGATDVASAQTCVQDRNGRIVCGNPVGPYYGPGPSPYYGPGVDRAYGGSVPYVGGRRFTCPAGSRERNGVCRP